MFLGAAMQSLNVLFVVFDELRCGDLDGALSCPVLVMIIILPIDVLLFYTRRKNILYLCQVQTVCLFNDIPPSHYY